MRTNKLNKFNNFNKQNKPMINVNKVAQFLAYLSIIGMTVYVSIKTNKSIERQDNLIKSDYSLYLCPDDSVIATNYWGQQTKVAIDDLPQFIKEE